ncbi:glycine betaine ABC transporter substrate-binding protein [Pseudomonas sp. NA13]
MSGNQPDQNGHLRGGSLFTPVELKSESALNAAIISAYEKGQPFMTYYWDPSPLMGELALTRLEEPTYSEACWDAISDSLAQFKEGVGSRQACAYADIALNKYTSAKFAKEHQAVIPFLKSMFVGTDTIRTLATRMVSNKETPSKRRVITCATILLIGRVGA